MTEATPADELIERTQGGDREAFAQLYDDLSPIAWRVAWIATSDRGATEEIVGDAMMALVDALPELPPKHVRVVGWVKMVVRNKSVDWIRKQSRRRKAKQDLVCQAEARATRGESAEASLFREETREQVREALKSLDETAKSALLMRYVNEMSCQEIAEVLELSGPATNSLLYRARIRFRDAMKRTDGFEDLDVTGQASPSDKTATAARSVNGDNAKQLETPEEVSELTLPSGGTRHE